LRPSPLYSTASFFSPFVATPQSASCLRPSPQDVTPTTLSFFWSVFRPPDLFFPVLDNRPHYSGRSFMRPARPSISLFELPPDSTREIVRPVPPLQDTFLGASLFTPPCVVFADRRMASFLCPTPPCSLVRFLFFLFTGSNWFPEKARPSLQTTLQSFCVPQRVGCCFYPFQSASLLRLSSFAQLLTHTDSCPRTLTTAPLSLLSVFFTSTRTHTVMRTLPRVSLRFPLAPPLFPFSLLSRSRLARSPPDNTFLEPGLQFCPSLACSMTPLPVSLKRPFPPPFSSCRTTPFIPSHHFPLCFCGASVTSLFLFHPPLPPFLFLRSLSFIGLPASFYVPMIVFSPMLLSRFVALSLLELLSFRHFTIDWVFIVLHHFFVSRHHFFLSLPRSKQGDFVPFFPI